MNSTTFSVSSRTQNIIVKLENIKSKFDGLRSMLEIHTSLTLRRPDDNTLFDLVQVKAILNLNNPTIFLSETITIDPICVYNDEFDTIISLNFILDDKSLFAIEKNRKGDAQFMLDFVFGLTIKNKFEVVNMPIYSSRSHKETTYLYLTIPKSIWVEQHLANLGHKNLKLIEIPVNHKKLKEAYDDIIFEFDKAEKYFNELDYDKCVAHCRSTLDALTRNLIKIKKNTPSETAFKWFENIGVETSRWIDELNKSSQSISSKTHHSGHKKEFTRQEAESIYLVILGLLNFVGNLKESYS